MLSMENSSKRFLELLAVEFKCRSIYNVLLGEWEEVVVAVESSSPKLRDVEL